MDALEVAIRLTLGTSLLIALGLWLWGFLGRFKPKKQPTEAQRALWVKSQPLIIGTLGLATLVEVLVEGSGNAGVLLAAFALLGWSQDRLMRKPAVSS